MRRATTQLALAACLPLTVLAHPHEPVDPDERAALSAERVEACVSSIGEEDSGRELCVCLDREVVDSFDWIFINRLLIQGEDTVPFDDLPFMAGVAIRTVYTAAAICREEVIYGSDLTPEEGESMPEDAEEGGA